MRVAGGAARAYGRGRRPAAPEPPPSKTAALAVTLGTGFIFLATYAHAGPAVWIAGLAGWAVVTVAAIVLTARLKNHHR